MVGIIKSSNIKRKQQRLPSIPINKYHSCILTKLVLFWGESSFNSFMEKSRGGVLIPKTSNLAQNTKPNVYNVLKWVLPERSQS